MALVALMKSPAERSNFELKEIYDRALIEKLMETFEYPKSLIKTNGVECF